MIKNISIAGKKVFLLGPGPCNWFEIPWNFDINCFVGDYYGITPSKRKIISSNIDLLYLGPSSLRRLIRSSVIPDKPIITAKEHGIYIPKRIKDYVNFYVFDFNSKCIEAGCNLTTGVAAMTDLLLRQPKRLKVLGINFYKSREPYAEGYSNPIDIEFIKNTKGNHSGHNQELLFNFYLKNIRPNIEVEILHKSK